MSQGPSQGCLLVCPPRQNGSSLWVGWLKVNTRGRSLSWPGRRFQGTQALNLGITELFCWRIVQFKKLLVIFFSLNQWQLCSVAPCSDSKIPPCLFFLVGQWSAIFLLPCSHHHAICTSLISWLSLNAVWPLLAPPTRTAAARSLLLCNWLAARDLDTIPTSALKNHIEGQMFEGHRTPGLRVPPHSSNEWSCFEQAKHHPSLGWRGSCLAASRDWRSCGPICRSLKR